MLQSSEAVQELVRARKILDVRRAPRRPPDSWNPRDWPLTQAVLPKSNAPAQQLHAKPPWLPKLVLQVWLPLPCPADVEMSFATVALS